MIGENRFVVTNDNINYSLVDSKNNIIEKNYLFSLETYGNTSFMDLEKPTNLRYRRIFGRTSNEDKFEIIDSNGKILGVHGHFEYLGDGYIKCP